MFTNSLELAYNERVNSSVVYNNRNLNTSRIDHILFR
jgi:hypothetical protein